MKFDDFDLDLTKIVNRYSANLLDMCIETIGGSSEESLPSSSIPPLTATHTADSVCESQCDGCPSRKFTCFGTRNCG